MAVQFVLGRSGTGKTNHCITAIINSLLKADDTRPLVLLVPEQATYQAERAILSDKRISGYSKLNVLSFDRLWFLLLGKNTTKPTLSQIGRQMIIHRILRDNSSKLKVFGSSAVWPGLSQQMSETISELHQYAKEPEDIDQLLGELQKDECNNLTVLKFIDIGLVFKEYLKFIEGRFVDSDIQLIQSRREIGKASFIRGGRLWVDGFAGFTTVELAVLGELLKVAADTQIALCLDPSDIDLMNPCTENVNPVSLFNPIERTYTALIKLVKECKLQLAKPIILEKTERFSLCSQLAHIERNIFELETAKMPSVDNIRIISAANTRLEVQFIARQILRLVKEQGLRYRDIAVIASDICCYQHYIKAYFDDYAIPFFIDERRCLEQHPIVQLICSAVQIVVGGFSGSDVFSYLKTGLVPIEYYDVDLLENYCIAFGVSAGDWQSGQDWCFAGQDDRDFDERRINQIRIEVSRALFELQDKLCPADNPTKKVNASQFTQIVFDFLDSLGVSERMGRWVEEARERKDYTTVDEHLQFYSKLVDVFDELVEVFDALEMPCQDYLTIIKSVFSQLTLAFIPPTSDQVLVGSIDRSRHPDLKAVFLIGTTQKQFPSPIGYTGVLTNDDRIAAESAKFSMAAATDQKLAERQYLTYIAFTRSSQFLYVTYPLTDEKGGPVARSQFITNLESLFEDINEESFCSSQVDLMNIHNKNELADILCSQLGKDMQEEQFSELLSDVCRDTQLAELGSMVRLAVGYDNRTQLDKNIIEKIFTGHIKSSATKLGSFAACPYQYFARYVLELKERKEFKFEPLDIGVFYHRVLDALMRELNLEKRDFASATDQELSAILREQTLKFVQTDSFISNFIRHSAHNAFIIYSAGEVLEDCVMAIAQMVRAGSFRPVLSEVTFGQAEDMLGEYKIPLSNNRLILMRGKIDRLDGLDARYSMLDTRALGHESQTAVVFDYKRREKSFRWAKFYNGLDMQLPIYMLAARCAKRSKAKNVIGAFYIPVEVSPAKATLDELAERDEDFNYKARGIFNGQFFQQLDREISSGWSEFYNFCVAKEKGQYGRYGNSGALRPGDFEKVLRFTERKIIQLVNEILSGRIDVNPYRLGTETPCGYCKYKAVCRFDWQINDYRALLSLGKDKILEMIGDD